MRYKFRSSKSAKKEFALKMQEIGEFCKVNNITQSYAGDSYYFTINNISYRVSNHTVEKSNWHDGRVDGVVYIHASKTRIIEIYNNLKKGLKLDGRGRIRKWKTIKKTH